LGPQAAGPVIVTILVDMVFTTSLCIALSRLDGAGLGGEGGRDRGLGFARQAAANALKGVATNPMPWAIVAGGAGIGTGASISAALGANRGAAGRCSLAGGVIHHWCRVGALAHAGAGGRGPPCAVAGFVPVAAIKLLVHPVLVLLVGSVARHMGVAIDHFSLTALVLVAALPSASNVSLLAERYGADNGRIARIILASTAQHRSVRPWPQI
jgi:malonate transporter